MYSFLSFVNPRVIQGVSAKLYNEIAASETSGCVNNAVRYFSARGIPSFRFKLVETTITCSRSYPRSLFLKKLICCPITIVQIIIAIEAANCPITKLLRNKFDRGYLDWADRTPAIIPSFKNYEKSRYPFSLKKVLKMEKNGLVATFTLFWLFDYAGQIIDTRTFNVEMNPAQYTPQALRTRGRR